MTAKAMNLENYMELDWSKRTDGLMPAIIQDAKTKQVLMEGFMNPASLKETLETGKVVFQSRKRGRWMKGETSGNYLLVSPGKNAIRSDCDEDALLILVNPIGPTCHIGTTSCFGNEDPASVSDISFLCELEGIILDRKKNMPEGSYTTKLFNAGIERMAQKVGEEGIEVALAAVGGDKGKIIGESADLIFHLKVLLAAAGISFKDVVDELSRRHAKRPEKGGNSSTSANAPQPE